MRESDGQRIGAGVALGGMFRLPMILVATLFGFAVSAPAQIEVHGHLGRHVSVTARIGDRHPAPVVRREPRARDRNDRDYNDRDHRGHNDRDHRGHIDRSPHGYFRDVCEQVWVEGFWREDYVPAVYGWITDHCGRRSWGVVRPAHTCRVFVPGHFESRTRRVWVSC